MLVQYLVQREGAASLDHYRHRESKDQDVIFNSMALFISIPVHKESELPVNGN